jgi:hypothetical protein
VRRLSLAAYFRDRSTDTTILMRAARITTAGLFVPEILTTGVLRWDVQVQFANGALNPGAIAADPARNFCEISNVIVDATLTTDRPADPRIASSAAVTRPFQWNYVARNLVFQRNARRGRPCI